jgi:hypothetical protein
MKRKTGMHITAFRAFITACYESKLSPNRIGQTLGGAILSHGTHARDGEFINENGKRESYSAAVDIRINDITEQEENRLMLRMRINQFAVWRRNAGVFSRAPHLHAIYIPLKKKEILDRQVEDFLNARSGLAGHRTDWFWTAHEDEALLDKLRELHQTSKSIT